MSLVHPSPLLTFSLRLDAALTAGTALLQLALAAPLAAWLQLPHALVLESGLFLVAWVAALALLSRASRISATVVRAIIAGNVAWAIGCVGLIAVVSPSAFGIAYLAMQVAAVLAFAALQQAGLRRSAAAATGAVLAR